jgi:hypothetical protein
MKLKHDMVKLKQHALGIQKEMSVRRNNNRTNTEMFKGLSTQ